MTNSIDTGTGRPMPPIALVVNDDRDTAEIYERLLSGEGMWVTSCSEREAFEYARDVLPDLILSDLDVRPGASGRDILQCFRDDPGLRDVPVVLIAALPPDGQTVQQVDTVLIKPVQPDSLLASVHAIVDRSRVLRARSRSLRHSVAAVLSRSQRAIERSERLARANPYKPKQETGERE